MGQASKRFCMGLVGVLLAGSAQASQIEEELTFEGSPLATKAGEWQLVHEALVSIPGGNSYSRDYFFEPTLEASELMVTMTTPAGGARCGATTSFLEVAFRADQHVYTNVFADVSGVYAIPEGTVKYLRYNNYYTGMFETQCVRRLYARSSAPQPPPPSDDFEFFGVISYEGGFQNVGLSIARPEKLARFWIRVPQYCTDLEILEAGTVTEGVFDRATRIESEGEWMFDVNGGAGARVSAIKATLNGPRTMTCDLPVYVVFAE